MKILIPLYQIQDYGGITSHCEYMMRGLIEVGHEVRLVILRPRGSTYMKRNTFLDDAYPSILPGVQVHLTNGWYGVPVIAYDSPDFYELRDWADYIIWELPCPYKDRGPWREMYAHHTPQVAVIHDAHYRRAYPHLDDVSVDLDFIAPVNECAFNCVEPYPGEKKLICNGMEIVPEYMDWGYKNDTAVCAHVWKRWKNMHKVVAAGPHMRHQLIMGGDGIEGRYMRSKDKVKPEYKGLWDKFNAAHNCSYTGILKPHELKTVYMQSRVQIDLSYAGFSQYGAHFNRSILEAANFGCVSLVDDRNMKDSKFFKAGKTHIGLRADITAPVLASVIDSVVEMGEEQATDILYSCREVLRDHFDYKKTSLAYLQAR